MGVLFYGETMGWLEVGGIGLTLIGIVLVNRTTSTTVESASEGNDFPPGQPGYVLLLLRRPAKHL